MWWKNHQAQERDGIVYKVVPPRLKSWSVTFDPAKRLFQPHAVVDGRRVTSDEFRSTHGVILAIRVLDNTVDAFHDEAIGLSNLFEIPREETSIMPTRVSRMRKASGVVTIQFFLLCVPKHLDSHDFKTIAEAQAKNAYVCDSKGYTAPLDELAK